MSDKRIALDTENDGIINYYSADVVTANDFFPGGMNMPGRKYTAAGSGYRYGFNGQELDNSTGEGNLDFGARIMDVRLGRFLSVDDRLKELPYFSPYIFVNNNPIQFLDPDGDFLLDVHQRIVSKSL